MNPEMNVVTAATSTLRTQRIAIMKSPVGPMEVARTRRTGGGPTHLQWCPASVRTDQQSSFCASSVPIRRAGLKGDCREIPEEQAGFYEGGRGGIERVASLP